MLSFTNQSSSRINTKVKIEHTNSQSNKFMIKFLVNVLLSQLKKETLKWAAFLCLLLPVSKITEKTAKWIPTKLKLKIELISTKNLFNFYRDPNNNFGVILFYTGRHLCETYDTEGSFAASSYLVRH